MEPYFGYQFHQDQWWDCSAHTRTVFISRFAYPCERNPDPWWKWVCHCCSPGIIEFQVPPLFHLFLISESSEAECRLDPSGWAWLVCGRKLLIWRFHGNSAGKVSHTVCGCCTLYFIVNWASFLQPQHCYELKLPNSSYSASADLVCLLAGSSHGPASCVACSSEGNLRYWPNIAQANSFADLRCEATGDEFVSIITLKVPRFPFIIRNTTMTILNFLYFLPTRILNASLLPWTVLCFWYHLASIRYLNHSSQASPLSWKLILFTGTLLVCCWYNIPGNCQMSPTVYATRNAVRHWSPHVISDLWICCQGTATSGKLA